MKNIFSTALFFCLSPLLFAADTTPIVLNWPDGAVGNYVIRGGGLDVKAATASGNYTVEDGKAVRLVGAGFDINFVAKAGKLTFPQRSVNNGGGANFDPATNTFSFVTTEIQTTVKNCDVPVTIDGTALAATGAQQTWKPIVGHHSLRFGGSTLGFTVDEKGIITLQETAAGFTVHNNQLAIEGLPLQVETSVAWSIHGADKNHVTGNGAVSLLPGANMGYIFQGGKANTPFFVNNDGLVALQVEGPYTETITLADDSGAEVAKLMIPNGAAKQTARLDQEKTDLALHDKVLAASATATWKQDMPLVEYMKVYDFPEEQLNYPVELSAGAKAADLKLLEFTDKRVQSLPFQLSADGKTLSFRSDLPQGATRLFRLVSGFDVTGIPAVTFVAPSVEAGTNPQEAVLGNDRILVKVPAGHQAFAGGKPLAQVSAPILGMARKAQPQPWMATGSFTAPDSLLVDSMDAKTLESGPVFTTYEIDYKLQGGKTYTVTLELRANEPEVRIDEGLSGFTSEDASYLTVDYGKGKLDPELRLAGSNSGYDLFSGAYDRDAHEDKLNYALGLFTPNGLGLMRTTAFYKQDGTDALLLSINRPEAWQTEKRAVWSSLGAFENIRFYNETDGRKYLTAGLSGKRRLWVMGLIPRSEVVLTVLPNDKALGAGPESRLFNTLTIWSLNAYKDRTVDWDEKLDAAPFDRPDFVDFQYDIPSKPKPVIPMTFDEYKKKYFDTSTYFHDFLNYSSNMGGNSDRAAPIYFAEYALNRAKWTPEQRQQVRQFLVLLADYTESDYNQPHHSMMSGHPNFIMDTKQTIPYALATFPNHPRAKMWRESFMAFYDEWLTTYSRKDVPELNTKGGRWTENIACYVGQCFVGITPDQILMKSYDGTALEKSPKLQKLLTWMRDSFMSPNDGVRLLPPEGAHSFNFEPGHIGRKVLFKLPEDIADTEPELSQEFRWIETNGKEGKQPDVRSGLFTDYGPVFHYDFGGAHESYAHLQNIYGSSYRWSAAGIVYYGAKNKVLSYNTAETNGDEFKIGELSAFNVKGKFLTPGPTDQLLYDFDFAQFYRQPGSPDDAYLARALMLVRDDFLAISDEVKAPEVPGTFNWVSACAFPEIYQLKPGATAVEGISRDPQPVRAGNPDRKAQMRTYTGEGDFLTIIAPEKVTAVATPSGATVNGEYVFASQKGEDVTEGKATFAGNYGYAKAGQLALFQGTKIGLDGFELRRDGGDFGVSASVDKNTISGRIVGRSGGKISIVPPSTLNPSSASVTFDGKPVKSTTEQGAVTFTVDIAQKDGLKNYEITFK